MFPNGSIYIENKVGPSTEPCGTPWLTLVCTDDSSLICTNWNRSAKYDLNQLRAVPLMLINCSSLCNKIAWSIVLNAALRSNRTRTDTNPWSEAIRRSLVTLARAVSVLWLALNPDWKSRRRHVPLAPQTEDYPALHSVTATERRLPVALISNTFHQM